MSEDPAAVAARIAARCESGVNRLARQIVSEQERLLPIIAELPADVRDVEMAGTSRHALRLFLRTAQGYRATREDMRLFKDRAAQRVNEGVHLAPLLSAYMVGNRRLWQALCEATLPGEEAGLRHLADQLFASLERTTAAVCEAYLSEVMLAERGEALRAVARALLSGQGASDVASRHGVELEPAYRVVALVLAAPVNAVGVRRRLRAVEAELERYAGAPVLATLDEHGGHALLPLSSAEPGERLLRRLGGDVYLGVTAACPVSGIPEAAREATRVAEVARATGRPSGVYGLRDVLLDFHLSAPGPSGAAIAALLDPLDEVLVETLEAYVAADLDRRATALALGVHPNTIDNRLARAGTLMGTDLRTSAGLLLVATALATRRTG